MNKLIEDLQELVDKKADNHELKRELGTLVKMLKSGFEKKTTGMEKIPKLYASNDAAKIKSFYDNVGNQINALKLSGNFDLFAEYLKITYGIEIAFSSETSPNNRYISKDKKRKKFNDLYTGYYLEDVPKEANDAITKILSSLDVLTKEYNTENDSVKDALKEIIQAQTENSPATVKTVDKIMTSARLKSLKVSEVANDAEAILNLQLQGIDILLKDEE